MFCFQWGFYCTFRFLPLVCGHLCAIEWNFDGCIGIHKADNFQERIVFWIWRDFFFTIFMECSFHLNYYSRLRQNASQTFNFFKIFQGEATRTPTCEKGKPPLALSTAGAAYRPRALRDRPSVGLLLYISHSTSKTFQMESPGMYFVNWCKMAVPIDKSTWWVPSPFVLLF